MGPATPSHRLAIGWGALALGGLVLGLLALTSPWQGLEGEGPGAVLALHVPDSLLAAILALTSLAVLLFLALVVPLKLRRKRKDDEEFELYHEPPKVSPWVLLLLGALALVPVAILVALLWADWSPVAPGIGSPGHAAAPPAAPPPGAGAPGRPAVSLPAFSGAVGGIALVAALGSLALMLWVFFGDRLASWWFGPLGEAPVPEPLLDAVEASLGDLRRDPDTRRAIILCYRRFEQVLGGVGLPRSPWETPTEFMGSVLARLPIPPIAVRRLTDLFERARFSEHPLGSSERDAAVDSLIDIKAALGRAASHAAAA